MEAVLVGLAAAAVSLAYSFGKWWFEPRNESRRALKRVKNVAIGEVRHGERVKVTGLAGAVGPMAISPIGRKVCIGFRLVVVEVDDGGNRRVILNKEACAAFNVRDGTGKAHVEGPFLIGLDLDGNWSQVPAEAAAVMEQADASTEGLLGQPRFRYREALLADGDRVTVLGRAFVEVDPTEPAAGARSPPVVARMHGSTEEPIVVADADELVSR